MHAKPIARVLWAFRCRTSGASILGRTEWALDPVSDLRMYGLANMQEVEGQDKSRLAQMRYSGDGIGGSFRFGRIGLGFRHVRVAVKLMGSQNRLGSVVPLAQDTVPPPNGDSANRIG